MKYEFRYYKDLEKLEKENRVPEIDKDYILLLEYDDESKNLCWPWLNTKEVAGKASSEYIYEKDFGYKNLDFERLLVRRDEEGKAVRDWGFSHIHTYRSRYPRDRYQWVET